jgi:nicotinamidase/pyrazinamidase
MWSEICFLLLFVIVFIAFIALPKSQSSGKKKRALLIIDVQNDFLPASEEHKRPVGSLQVADGNAVIPVINALRKRVKFDFVALTQDWHPKDHCSFQVNNAGSKVFEEWTLPNGQKQMMWPAHCVQESEGSKLASDLVVEKSDVIVKKGKSREVDSYSGFYDNDHKTKSEMEDVLRNAGVTELFIVGLAYDYCVGFSAIDAKNAGFDVFVLEDATRGVAEPSTKSMIERLNKLGVHIIKSSDVPTEANLNKPKAS